MPCARSSSKQRKVICLMDGEHKLWERKDQLLSEGVVEILDFWHFLERPREVSKLLCDTDAADESFVKDRLARVLNGELGRVIGGLRQMLSKRRRSQQKRRLSKKSQATIQSAIMYFENNRLRMRYGEYLREGLQSPTAKNSSACSSLIRSCTNVAKRASPFSSATGFPVPPNDLNRDNTLAIAMER